MSKFSGGCDHIHTHLNGDPIDNHICHCSVCKRVYGQPTTHVVFFHHSDLEVDNADGINKQPFNDQNPDGPGESWTCSTCGTPIVMNDKLNRIRAIVPILWVTAMIFLKLHITLIMMLQPVFLDQMMEEKFTKDYVLNLYGQRVVRNFTKSLVQTGIVG